MEEENRHNMKMEEKKGSGLYLRKNERDGYGLVLNKDPKNLH